MRDLDLRMQQDDLAKLSDARAELDILDLRAGEMPFVVHARVLEHLSPHRSRAGPEGVDFTRVLLVYVVMQEVSVLRHETCIGRRVIVRSEYRTSSRLPHQDLGETAYGVGVYHHIGIEEHHDLATRYLKASIACIRRTVRLPGKTHDRIGITSGHGRRVVAAGVIDHDEFPSVARVVAGNQRA